MSFWILTLRFHPNLHNCFFNVYYLSAGIDIEFEHALEKMFGKDLIEHYRQKYPMGWVDLMVAFESRKRSANPNKPSSLNISIPFSFIDYYKKHKVKHLYLKQRFY